MAPPRNRRPLRPEEHGARAAAHLMRRRNRRGRHRRRGRAAAIVAVLVVALAISVVGDRRRHRDGALGQLRPLDPEARRDRPELVRLRGRRQPARLDPGREEPRAGAARAHQPVAAEGHGRGRGPALLPATAASTTRASPARSGRTSAPARSSRAARRSRSSSSRTSTPAASGRFERKLKEACLAMKLSRKLLEAAHPARVPEHRLLRQPRLRRRGRVADLLQPPREPADARPVGAARRAAAGAVDLRPVPQPEGGDRAAQRGAAGDVEDRRDHAAAVPRRAALRTSSSMPGRIYKDIQQPYFFTYVTDELQRVYGTNTVREGGLRVYTTIEPRLPAEREARDQGDAELQRRPGRRDRLGRAGNRRDPRDGRP